MNKFVVTAGLGVLATTASLAQVGMREATSQGMKITLVYPTQERAQILKRGLFEIEVAINAKPTTQSRHLIVMSHGSGGSALADFTLAATLARAGFVVAQPEHRGDNSRDFRKSGPESWDTRPKEISEAIDFVAKDAQWGGQLDFNAVGVHGMSAGGATALIMAGGQWRMQDLIRHCGNHLDEDIGFCLNGLTGQPVKQVIRKTQFKTAVKIPEKWLPENFKIVHGAPPSAGSSTDSRPDNRVVAVSALVPVSAIFTAESLAKISIPVGLTTAGKDEMLVPEFHSDHVMRNCPRCTILTSNPSAGHFDWLSPWPAELAQKIGSQQIRGGEVNPEFTPALRQSGFDRIADFFRSTLHIS